MKKNFNLEESYLEIFLTKTISKTDLLELLTQEKISFGQNFNLETANQFDMGMILMHDTPTKKLLQQVEILRANKYQKIKPLKEIGQLISNIEKYDREKLANIYLQAPFDPLAQKIIEGALNNKSSQLTKEDILFFFLEGFLQS